MFCVPSTCSRYATVKTTFSTIRRPLFGSLETLSSTGLLSIPLLPPIDRHFDFSFPFFYVSSTLWVATMNGHHVTAGSEVESDRTGLLPTQVLACQSQVRSTRWDLPQRRSYCNLWCSHAASGPSDSCSPVYYSRRYTKTPFMETKTIIGLWTRVELAAGPFLDHLTLFASGSWSDLHLPLVTLRAVLSCWSADAFRFECSDWVYRDDTSALMEVCTFCI